MQAKRRLCWKPLIFLRNMAILTVLLLVLATTALSSEQPAQNEEYVVRQGDTLWNIAIEHNPKSDPRITVNAICKLNSLESKNLQPGMRLMLP